MKNIKTFIVTYSHNYGLGATIINTKTEEEAHKICKKSDYIWDNYELEELDTSIKVKHLGH